MQIGKFEMLSTDFVWAPVSPSDKGRIQLGGVFLFEYTFLGIFYATINKTKVFCGVLLVCPIVSN